MLKDVKWAVDRTYRPGEEHDPVEFFTEALCNSKEFDIQLGYFNSGAISVLCEGFASFIANGGMMRMAINQIVSDSDKRAIIEGQKNEAFVTFDLTDMRNLKSVFSEYDRHFFHCLAYLIQQKRIDLKIIRPISSKGISHTKCGVFKDGEMVVAFTGSANFTVNGLINNREDIVAMLSTSSDDSIKYRIDKQMNDFTRVMEEKDPQLEYLSVEKLESAIASSFGGADIEDLIDVENRLRAAREYNKKKQAMRDGSIIELDGKPAFPYPSGPRPYQNEAFENWKKTQKGLFAMATGTGKTITSLNCLLEIYKRKKYYKALILVPTLTLVNQWEEECYKFNFNNVVKVSSKNQSWRQEIARIKVKEQLNADSLESYIIISTYASFSRDTVFLELNSLPKTKVLLIADEAHNMGAGKIRNKLNSIGYARRIGLSATPKRQFDDVGNHELNKFFGAEDHYTFEYPMAQAIEEGRLCRYEYYPHIVPLTSKEMDDYKELTLRIVRLLGSKTIIDEDNKDVKDLLLARKRIVHQAVTKKSVFENILRRHLAQRGSLKYTLVYVPEGNKPDSTDADIFDCAETIPDDDDTMHLINQYSAIVKNVDPNIIVRQFTSGSIARESMLEDFAKGEIDVLTSMKCLDEGVDVPRSEMAIFCASTGNPRQFIQRRGRILRTHPDKHIAIIHDLIVAPQLDYESPSYNIERSLLQNELYRVRDFLSMAENANDSIDTLNDILNYYNLPLF